MALVSTDVDKIQFGPCQVTFGGTDLGFFKGGVTFTAEVTWLKLEVDQSSMPVGKRVQGETCLASVPMVETTLDKLQTVMQTGTYTLDSGGSKKKIEVGGLQIQDSDTKELVITPVSDGSATISTDANEKITIFKCIASPTLELGYNRDGERIVVVEFEGFRDASKAAGKQLFILGDTTATA